ncbi:MAG: ATP-binding protein, partial [Bacteroidota bacterium]
MSHEIRTPMNAVIGFADQLHSTTLNRQQHRLLDPLRHSAGYLLALINDVLDYSKLESGDFPLEKVGLSPKDILKETEETFFEQAKAKGLALKCMADPNLPPVVLGDPLRLKQMLFNLMSNALKFTESGSVVLRASRQPHSVATMAKLQFEVKDTGIGIPLEKQENIFSKFIQADTSTTRRYGGTGLGLAITKRLAEIQEGELTLVSEVGRGTTVTLVLPQQLGTEQDLLPDLSESPLDAATLAGRSVLLVDDELYNRELAQYVLNKWKVKVKSVESGVKALMHLERGEPVDLILMDLQMPNKDGFETTRLIREKLGLRDIPILAMTATSTPSEIQRAYAVGMNAHLLKPFRESDLLGLMLR